MLNRDDLVHFLNASVANSSACKVKHILVAEDNHANRLIAKTILERDGYKVTLVVNGLEAVQAVQHTSFDIILLDILMPIMDGIKALRRIRALSPHKTIPPIFAITAFCNPADQHRYRMAGFDAILTKPLQHGDVALAFKQFSLGTIKTPVKSTTDTHIELDTIPILDGRIIDQLRGAAPPAALKKIQSTFWTEIQSNGQIIQTALPKALNAIPESLAQMRKSVHAIKGASASIGLLRAAHIARHLQNAPPGNIHKLVESLFETLILSKAPLNTALFRPNPAHPPTANLNCAVTLQSGASAQIG